MAESRSDISRVRVNWRWLTLAAAVIAGPAYATADAPVQQALALAQQGRAGEAYALLAPLAATRAGDPDFDYALGLAAEDSGHRAEAIIALQRVLAVQPKNAPARAELARVYALTGDVDTAEREFSTVVEDPSLPDPVRQRFNQLVGGLRREQRAGGTSLSGYAEASSGYDSNINTATGLTSITLPLFASLGPAALSGTATRIDEAFGNFEGGLSVASGVSRQTRLFASLLGSYRDNYGSRTFDQGTLTGTAGVGFTRANRDVVSLSGQAQQFWLNRDSYRQAYSAIGQYTHRTAGGQALSFGVQYSRLDYRTDPLRDADRYTATASYTGKTTFVAVSSGLEDTRRAAGDNASNGFVGGRMGFERPLGTRFSVLGSAGLEYRGYRAPDPLFLQTRHDTQFDAALGFRVLVAPRVTLRPLATYTRNASNIDLYDYNRVTGSVAVRFEF
ncbi:DUF560 domain-containing protein [Sphingomonas antarctica]|uniref:tetratricopeptide repeat protein n=1 Tax=Sphingomonas antarctica TaxID=2040274 RepID=UPI0039ED86B5